MNKTRQNSHRLIWQQAATAWQWPLLNALLYRRFSHIVLCGYRAQHAPSAHLPSFANICLEHHVSTVNHT